MALHSTNAGINDKTTCSTATNNIPVKMMNDGANANENKTNTSSVFNFDEIYGTESDTEYIYSHTSDDEQSNRYDNNSDNDIDSEHSSNKNSDDDIGDLDMDIDEVIKLGCWLFGSGLKV